MVIHTKEKPRLHAKGAPKAKIKGRNILTVQRGPKIAGSTEEKSAAGNGKIKMKKRDIHVADKRKTVRAKVAAEDMEYRDRYNALPDRKESGTAQGRHDGGNVQGRNGAVQDRNGNRIAQDRTTGGNTQGSRGKEQEIRQSVSRENRMYAQYRRTKAEKEAAIKKKPPVSVIAASTAAKVSLDEMDGGSEVYDAYMTADTLVKPATNAADAGRNLYRLQAAKVKQQKLRKKQSTSRIREKIVQKGEWKTAEETVPASAKETARETGRERFRETRIKGAKETRKVTSGTGSMVAGIAAGETDRGVMDRRDAKNFTRIRMINLFVAKLRQEENQDNIGKALKDIAMMRFSMMAKYIVRYVGLFLLALSAIVALVALPVIVIITVIYNSPFAIFFPSISSGETIQEVLSAYVSEFNNEVNEEVRNHAGYDKSEKIYVGFEGSGIPDNFCDILMVYMVKYGDGDTATDMTDKAKQNLKAVFNDMCSYTITSRTDTDTDDDGDTTRTTVKEVNVKLKSCYDMVSVYGFNAKQQEVLAELMKPEYLAMLGYTGGGGDPGEGISPDQYQAIVDDISDENGRKVVAFALSKVGYPYSQAHRDSGDYYDCSSLAYYAWRSAGVSIMYEGSNTAASEGQFCYENNLLVSYDEMQPGDLIFYSYDRNGRFMNITHVAIYAGNGKLVEAANARLGVVYRPVYGRSSIVLIGRPR